MPYIFDEPVEKAVEWGFRKGLETYVGEHAVQPLRLPSSHKLQQEQSGSGSGAESKVLSSRLKATSEEKPDVAVSWEEYKEKKQRERDERMKEREEKGIKGPLAMLGFWTGKGKSE